MSTTTTYFITGTNRDIGYAFVEQLSTNPNNKIIATVRDLARSTKLQELAKHRSNISIITLDLSNEKSINELNQKVSKITSVIDVFISNGGVITNATKVLETPRQDYLDAYIVNGLAPIFVLKNIYEFFKDSKVKKILFLTSQATSMNGGPQLSFGSYTQSKAASNFTAYNLSYELAPEKFIVFSIHPGIVTSASSIKAAEYFPEEIKKAFAQYAITPEESAKNVLKVLEKADESYNGKLFNAEDTQLSY